MFESICIRNQSSFDVGIDVGFLAETMLFYSDVLVIAREQMIEQLVRGCGPAILIDLLQTGRLRLRYEHELTGIQTRGTGSGREKHSGVRFHSPDHALQHVAPRIFQEVTGRPGKGRRLANRFIEFVQPIDRGPDALAEFGSDLLDKRYLESVTGLLLKHYAPEYDIPQPLMFQATKAGEEYAVETNIDFVEVNKSYHRRVSPSHSSVTQALLLTHILTARDNLYFASSSGADLAVDPLNSQVLVSKVSGILDHYNKNISQIGTFEDFIFDDGKAIGEAINSGQRSFADFLKLLEHADKFREWLRNKPPSANLTKEYFREVTSSSWIDKLPGKSFRWSFFTGAGLVADAMGAGGIGTAAGLALSAADAFLLDRVIKGWKPNQFIEGPLQKFVKQG